MKIVCLIPAKANSQRVKNKNLRLINNKPLLEHVIINAKKSKIFEEIFVSTESNKIKKIAEKNGASVPFLRNKSLSKADTPVDKVIFEFLRIMDKKLLQIDALCILYPTSIFINHKIIKKCFNTFKKREIDYIFAAREFEHPPERSFYYKNNATKLSNPNDYYKRTQDFKRRYYDLGQIYIGKKNTFLKKIKPQNSKSTIILLDNFEAIDIDYPNDLKNAKKLYKFQKFKKSLR
jgi:pseudaminic acid cytidylyltransferase